VVAAGIAAAVAAVGSPAGATPEVTETALVSATPLGDPGTGNGFNVAISANGRFVAFDSAAGDLVADDDNDLTDVFVRDMVAGTTERVSVATDGSEGDGDSYEPSISADGRYVVFTSDSDLLDPIDDNGSTDVFRHDRLVDATALVSLDNSDLPAEFGAEAGVISGNGNVVAFTTDSEIDPNDQNFDYDVYVRDLVAGTTKRASLSAAYADSPALDFDGRYVVFGRPCGNTNCIFRRDLTVANQGVRVSVSTSGTNPNHVSYSPSISGDGNRVAYSSLATNLVVAPGGDPPLTSDVFLYDLTAATTTMVSVDVGGGLADGQSFGARLSGDGEWVVFVSQASDLTGGFDDNDVSDVFVRNLALGETTRVSFDHAGGDPDDAALSAALNADGSVVAYTSDATDVLASPPAVVPQTYRAVLDEPVDDTVAPDVALTRPGGRVTLAAGIPVAWNGSDLSGVDHFDVDRRVARWNGSFEAWGAAPWSPTDATSATYAATYGRTVCLRARATDTVGNTSATTAPRCSTVPLRADHLTYTPSFTIGSAGTTFGGKYALSKSKGAVAKRDGIVAERLYLIATTCPTCGSVAVSWNGVTIKTISLKSSTTKRSQVFGIVAWPTRRTGTFRATVQSSGATVMLEGLAVHQD
jgi:Tol biopolymer transport system component